MASAAACSRSPRRPRAARGIGTLVLYTHEKMSENQALYARLGYVADEWRRENGFSRVFMSKRLA